MSKGKLHNYDSDEEWYFSWYLEELADANFIRKAIYHPESYLLSQKQSYFVEKNGKKKNATMHLLNKHIYTADWEIIWDDSAVGVFIPNTDENWKALGFYVVNKHSIIDIKGMFAGKNNTSALTFPLNQKWVYQMHKIYVQKVIPIKIFKNTFTPQRYLLTDKKTRKRKINFETRNLGQYVQRFN